MSEKIVGKKCHTNTRNFSETERDHKRNTITRKQKLHNKTTPDPINGQSRYITTTDKVLANDKISNSLESQHNDCMCMGIKVEPQEDASEKRSEQFEMIEIKCKFEHKDDFESNDPLLDVNVQQIKGLDQALPPNDQQEVFNGKRDVLRKPQEKRLKIYNTEKIPIKHGLETTLHTKQLGMWQPRLAVSHDQVMVLLAELQENPEAARGFSRMAEGRRRNKRFWTQLARTLNAVRGGAHKNADGWAKYWQDKKRNVKASVARREASCPVSGADDQEVRTPLTDVEQRVVAIMGGLAFANGDAQLRIPVFCGEGPRTSSAAATPTQSSSDDNMMEIPVTPAPVALENASFAQPEPLPQAPSPPPPLSWSSPLPSPPSAQSAQPPPTQTRNALKSEMRVDDENLALLRRQHEEKMDVERERNRLLSQLVEKVDKAVGMLGEVLSRIPR